MDNARPKLRVAFVGWGAIAGTVARMIESDPIEIVAVAVRDTERDRALAVPTGAEYLDDPDGLAAVAPDIVVEAAGREAVESWGLAACAASADFVISSVSALADPAVLERLRTAAIANGCHVSVSPGALAGVDALAAAQTFGIDWVEHRIVKPPKAWVGTDAETLCDLDHLTEATEFYRGSAAETAQSFPKNANVAMTTALAGVGPDATTIVLVADPTATTNRHEIAAEGKFGRLAVAIDNNPLPDNPKTSAMAALSLVRLLRNRSAPIRI